MDSPQGADRPAHRPGLAFAHLNLRRNPFGEPLRAERGELAVADRSMLEEWVERLHRPGFAVQFLGECGRGKTTHLLALHRHFPTAPFVYVGPGERPRLPRRPRGAPFFLDEAQRIPRRRRARLFRRSVSFALGSHEDLGEELRSVGLEVVTVHAAEGMVTVKLEEIFRRRIEWARRLEGPVPTISGRTVESLVATYGTDVRAMERALYDAFQRAPRIEDVDV